MSRRKLTPIQFVMVIPLFAISIGLFFFVFVGGPSHREDEDSSPDAIIGFKRESFFRIARFLLLIPFTAALFFVLIGLFAAGGFIGNSYLALCLGVGGICYSVVSYFVLR